MVSTTDVLKTTLVILLLGIFVSCSDNSSFELKRGDHIAIIGNSLAERMQHDGWMESYMQLQYPNDSLVFRNLGYSGDQINYRPRSHKGFGDSDSHLTRVKANVIFAFFGYNESYNNTPDLFKEKLEGWVDYTLAQQYDSLQPPHIVLFSPIAHEDLKSNNLPDGKENNVRLAAYSQAMSEVAIAKNITYVDLFHGSQQLYAESEVPLTINGVHLNEEGNRQIGHYIAETLSGQTIEDHPPLIDSVRATVKDKNHLWFKNYRATSGNDVWGTRSIQDGNFKTLNRELEMMRVMASNRDKKIWARANGEDLTVTDDNMPEPLIVGTHIVRDVEFVDPEEAIDRMTLPSDLQVNLFASEKEFPEIINPVALQVDTRGRIWVASWGTYPKWQPGTPMNDRLVYLTDTDGDGKADEVETFAYVSNPTGFEFWNGGVIVISAPDVLFLKDTDGDGKADYRERIFGGIGSDDTHHTANNLIFGPDGNIYYQRGIFILENIETPYRDSEESGSPGLYRFNPRTYDFSFVVENTPNSHGISFDQWGNIFISDGTSGRAFQVYHKRTVTANSDLSEFDKRPLFKQTVRPVTSNQILTSAHFPDKYQNNFLVYNVIGFQGIKRYRLDYKEDGVVEGVEVGDLLYTGNDPTFRPNSEAKPRVLPPGYTGDPNFRPTDGVIGQDGALYFGDWQNPVITHSPYNLRDISRDKKHGRIYRITAKNRPLATPIPIYDQPVEDLLELFKNPIDAVKHQVRIELSGRDTDEVISKAQAWANTLDPSSREDALPLLEVLWLHQQHNVVNRNLLVDLLKSPEQRVRIAAQTVAWFWSDRPTHKRGSADSTVSGMQFRTFYEKYWTENHMEKTNSEPSASESSTKDVPESSEVEDLPSKRIVLDNKGVGPIKNLELPTEIDQSMVLKGKNLFDTKCITCHLADKNVIGPAPKGILKRRSPEWIMNMILNPAEMLEKDPLAKELLVEFKGTPMIDEGMTEEEARAMLEYFRTLE